MVRAATVGLSIAAARLVGSAGAGALGVALQVAALGSMIAAFNLPQSLTRHLSDSFDVARRAALLRTSAIMILALSLCVGAVILIFAKPLALAMYRDPRLEPVLSCCGPLVVATACYMWVEGALQGLRRFEVLARWGAAASAADLVLGISGALVAGVLGMLAARIAVRLSATALAATRWIRAAVPGRASTAVAGGEVRDPGAAPEADSGAVSRALVGYAGPALLTALMVLVGQTALRLLLVRRAGMEAAGHFQAADSIAQGLILIPSAAATALMPAVARDRESGYTALPAALTNALRHVSSLSLTLSLLVIGVVPWIVPILFGRDFGLARPALVVLAAAYSLMGPGLLFGAVLLGRGEVWTGFAMNAAWVAVVVAAYGFIPTRTGAAGAAAAMAAGYLLLLLFSVIVLPRIWNLTAKGMLQPVVTSVVVTAAAGALALDPRVPAAITAVLCIGAAGVVMWRSGMPGIAASGFARLRR